MSVITVWKCDEDGKLFEDKKKYQNHLRKLARVRRERRRDAAVPAPASADQLEEASEVRGWWRRGHARSDDAYACSEARRSGPQPRAQHHLQHQHARR